MARKALRIILLAALSAAIAFPFIYLVSTSLFPARDFLSGKARLFPSQIYWGNFKKAFGYRYFFIQLLNSLATSTIAAIVKTIVSILTAFAFSHMVFKGKKTLFVILTATLFIPQDALLYQNYRTVASMQLLDTWLGIISTSLFSQTQMLLLYGSFMRLSKDYYDSARMDGAGDIRYIESILVPLSLPVVITVVMQGFIGCFNSYLWPLLVTNKPRTRTIQVGLTMLGFAESGDYGALMASTLIVVLPFILALAFGKKWIEKALIDSSMHS